MQLEERQSVANVQFCPGNFSFFSIKVQLLLAPIVGLQTAEVLQE
jgi:hypothetical protein